MSPGPSVKRRGGVEPSTLTTQIEDDCRSASSSASVTTRARDDHPVKGPCRRWPLAGKGLRRGKGAWPWWSPSCCLRPVYPDEAGTDPRGRGLAALAWDALKAGRFRGKGQPWGRLCFAAGPVLGTTALSWAALARDGVRSIGRTSRMAGPRGGLVGSLSSKSAAVPGRTATGWLVVTWT